MMYALKVHQATDCIVCAELKKLNQLNEDIDQLSAMAWDCETLAW